MVIKDLWCRLSGRFSLIKVLRSTANPPPKNRRTKLSRKKCINISILILYLNISILILDLNEISCMIRHWVGYKFFESMITFEIYGPNALQCSLIYLHSKVHQLLVFITFN